MRAQENFHEYDFLNQQIEQIESLCAQNESKKIIELLKKLVPEYEISDFNKL